MLGERTMEAIGISLAASLGAFALFGGIALMMWIDARNKQHERELKHTERIKALEMGQPLPDLAVASARAAQIRTVLLGLVCFLVPVGLAGIAVGATALVLFCAAPGIHLPVLCVIWGVVGLVSLVTIPSALQALGGTKVDDSEEEEAEKRKDTADKLSERIKEPLRQ